MSDMISDVSGIRIDQYLTSKLNITRSKIEKMIKEGNIKVNGNIIKKSYILNLNDEISIEEYTEKEIIYYISKSNSIY